MIQVLEDGDVADAPERAGRFVAGVRAALDELNAPAGTPTGPREAA